jgi:hypothetical protein
LTTDTYTYHGHTITILEGATYTNAVVRRPDGGEMTIPATYLHDALKKAKYYVRRWERGKEKKAR